MAELVKGADMQEPPVFRAKPKQVVVLVKNVDETFRILENRNALMLFIDELGRGKRWKAEARLDPEYNGFRDLRKWFIVRMDGKILAHAEEMEIEPK